MKSAIPVYDIENFKAYKNDGILVSRFGYYAQQHQHLHAAHRHSFFHLVFFTEGTGKHHIDFRTFDVAPGVIYFMVPGQVHSWDFESEPDGYIINFSTTYLSSFLLKQDYLERFSFFSGQPLKQVIKLPQATQQKLALVFEDMILEERQSNTEIDDDLVKTLLIRLFIEVSRFADTGQLLHNNTYNHTLLRSYQRLIETNYTKLRLPKQYASLLYITPNHLNSLCKEFLGLSAGVVIRERVLLEAKRLLINLELMVSEIATMLNFDDQSYFIKFFKKYEGITPERFRKLNTTTYGTK